MANYHKCGHARRGNKSREYMMWENMKSRCSNSKHPAYKHYGARGIKVCDRWKIFPNFLEDMGRVPPGMTLDRIDNNKGYEPGNCHWATMPEQLKNRRPFKLDSHDIAAIRILRMFGFQQKVIAEWFGVGQDHISRILSGERWQRGEVSRLPS